MSDHPLPPPVAATLPDGTTVRVEAFRAPHPIALAGPPADAWQQWRVVATGAAFDGSGDTVLAVHLTPELALEAAWVEQHARRAVPHADWPPRARFLVVQWVAGPIAMATWCALRATLAEAQDTFRGRLADNMLAEGRTRVVTLFDRQARLCLEHAEATAYGPAWLTSRWLLDDPGPFTGSAADDTPLPSPPTAGLGATAGGEITAVPASAQARIDRIVAAVHEGRADDESVARLTAWVERHEDLLSLTHQDAYGALTALSPVHVTGYMGPRSGWEGDIRDALDLDDAVPITDDHRLRFFEEHRLRALLEGGEAASYFGPLWLTAGDGRQAVLFADSVGAMLSAEVTTTWYGPHRTIEEFKVWLVADGWLLDPESFPFLPREEKLRLLRG